MPRYAYKCYTCKKVFEISHGMFFEGQRCISCHSDDVFRLPSLLEKNNITSSTKTGKIVNDYIEEAKKDIKKYKKDLSSEEL